MVSFLVELMSGKLHTSRDLELFLFGNLLPPNYFNMRFVLCNRRVQNNFEIGRYYAIKQKNATQKYLHKLTPQSSYGG